MQSKFKFSTTFLVFVLLVLGVLIWFLYLFLPPSFLNPVRNLFEKNILVAGVTTVSGKEISAYNSEKIRWSSQEKMSAVDGFVKYDDYPLLARYGYVRHGSIQGEFATVNTARNLFILPNKLKQRAYFIFDKNGGIRTELMLPESIKGEVVLIEWIGSELLFQSRERVNGTLLYSAYVTDPFKNSNSYISVKPPIDNIVSKNYQNYVQKNFFVGIVCTKYRANLGGGGQCYEQTTYVLDRDLLVWKKVMVRSTTKSLDTGWDEKNLYIKELPDSNNGDTGRHLWVIPIKNIFP